MQNQATMGGNDLATPVQAVSLSYNNQQTGPCARPSCRRITVNNYPNTNTNITSSMPNKVLRFGISAEGFLDGKNSYLAFDLQGTPVAAGTAYFIPTTEAMIHRISVYSNAGTLIEDIQNQELLGCILRHDVSFNYQSSVGRASLNMGTAGDLSAANAYTLYQANTRYICELRGSGFLNAFNYVPNKALANSQSNAFFLEVEFSSAANMITQTMGSDGAYVLSNCVYVTDIIYDDVKEAEIDMMLSQSPIVFHFPTWKAHNNTILGNSGNNNTLTISEFQESLEELALVFKNQNNINNPNNALWQFDLPNNAEQILNMQLKIGNYLYPVQNLPQQTGIAQQYYEYTKATCKNKCYDEGHLPLSYNGSVSSAATTDYVFRYPLRIMPNDANGDTVDYFFGINTRINPQSINLYVNTANLANTYIVQSYVKYDVSLVIMKTESYIVS